MRLLPSMTALVALSLVGGCNALRSTLGFTDQSAVDSPLTANKVFFLESLDDNAPAQQQDPFRFANLRHSYQFDTTADNSDRTLNNRNPLSIVVSRAYLPALPDDNVEYGNCGRSNARLADSFIGESRDIAVLLEVATSASTTEFIAVWYQRDVDPGQALSFQDLLVYSTDSWDARFPPYFRMRLVDVSNERNTIVGALLDQVRSSSKSILGMVGAPEAGPIINTATLAAEQVLANDRNHSLVDFTFQLYGAQLLEDAGGSPLGVLQEGGVIVTALPYGSCNEFWENNLQFDYRLDRVQQSTGGSGTGQELNMPYILATVIRADLAVPQVVQTRSAAILARLSDPRIVQTEATALQEELEELTLAVKAFANREAFSRRPSEAGFSDFVGSLEGDWDEMDASTRGFLLDYLYNVTAANRSTPAEYLTWYANCHSQLEFNIQHGRFVWPENWQPPEPGADGSVPANACTR